MESLAIIKDKIKNCDIEKLGILLNSYEKDEREGVKKLILSGQKRISDYEAENERLENMLIYERKYAEYSSICGIDEVGRGPLAGPVYAAAVILPRECKIRGVNDSKKLSEKQREELYEEITDKAVAWNVGWASNERIDEINILQATYEAMRMAVRGLKVEPDCLLNDAVIIPELNQRQVKIIKGDAKSISIAAASIVAKVTRDRLMTELSEKYPEYGFAGNKGYGSASHIEALKKYGPCEIHRRSFIGNFI